MLIFRWFRLLPKVASYGYKSRKTEKLEMREIDLYTYPEKYYPVNKDDSITKAFLTIELRDDLKEQILNMVFGNSNAILRNS